MHQKPSLAENALSIFRKIRSAHCTDAAISLSASTLLGIPNRSLAVLMYRREDRGHDSQNAFAAFVPPSSCVQPQTPSAYAHL
jgi:hypothetical protein